MTPLRCWSLTLALSALLSTAPAEEPPAAGESPVSAPTASQSAPAPSDPAAEALAPGAVLTLRLDKTTVMRFSWVPAGAFLMGLPPELDDPAGDEGPQTNATLTRGFWLAQTETTEAQWQAIMGEVGIHSGGGPEYPVGNVSWNQADEFCRYAARLKSRPIALPTEAQWERACRAGSTTLYSFGDDPALLQSRANVADAATKTVVDLSFGEFGEWNAPWNDGFARQAPAASLPPNA
jgi:formylglycine-generating enzyme required for sulfatase activity